VTDIPEDKTDARKIEKRRSWKEIASSASSASDPSADDYAIELELFERGAIDKSLWAKHLVEAKGDEEEAKWLYVKDRAMTAPARRAEVDRLEKERIAEKNAIRKREEEAAQPIAVERSAVEKVEETREQRRERERQARLIAQSIAKGTPSYYLNNPHMLQKDNTMRNVLLVIGVLVLVGMCAG
jgi:hypothetical protein